MKTVIYYLKLLEWDFQQRWEWSQFKIGASLKINSNNHCLAMQLQKTDA